MNEYNDKTSGEISSKWLITGMVFLVLFFLMTVLVIKGITQVPDGQAALAINHMKVGSALSNLLILASLYGREYFWIPIVAIMLLFGKRDTKLLAIELAALLVVGIIAGEAMKYVMYRARPFDTLTGIVTRVTRDADSSYPSGHALIVSIAALFSLAMFRRKSIALLLTLEAAIVCISRVYVGVHYPMDVISGIFLGGFIVFTGMFVIKKYLSRMFNRLADLFQRIIMMGLFSL